jgi:hypothetical protein
MGFDCKFISTSRSGLKDENGQEKESKI